MNKEINKFIFRDRYELVIDHNAGFKVPLDKFIKALSEKLEEVPKEHVKFTEVTFGRDGKGYTEMIIVTSRPETKEEKKQRLGIIRAQAEIEFKQALDAYIAAGGES